MKLILAAILPVLFSLAAFAHSGGTDAYGCHYDRKNGGYHCHNPKRGPNSNAEQKVVFDAKSKKFHAHNCKSSKVCKIDCREVTVSEAVKLGGSPSEDCSGKTVDHEH